MEAGLGSDNKQRRGPGLMEQEGGGLLAIGCPIPAILLCGPYHPGDGFSSAGLPL